MKRLFLFLSLYSITVYAAHPVQRAIPVQIIIDDHKILNLLGQSDQIIGDFIDAVEKEYGIIIEQVRLQIPSQNLDLPFKKNSRERFSDLHFGARLRVIATRLPSSN